MGLFAAGFDVLIWLCPILVVAMILPVIRWAFAVEKSKEPDLAGLGTMLGRALSKWKW